VFSTLASVKTISGGKYTHAYEFDSKAGVEQYIQEKLPRVAERMSIVNMGIYQENWKSVPAFAPQKERDGSFTFLRLKWPGEHQTHPEVIASQDTGAFVKALVLRHPPGTHVLGASEIISRSDYAVLWGRVMGVKVAVKDVSEEEYARYVPEDIRDTMLDLFKFLPEYGYAGGNASVKTPTELGIQTTSLETFIRNENWSTSLRRYQLEETFTALFAQRKKTIQLASFNQPRFYIVVFGFFPFLIVHAFSLLVFLTPAIGLCRSLKI
jgi:hypothetical protein